MIFCEEALLDHRFKETFLKSLLEWSRDAMWMKIFTMFNFLDSLKCK